jgi:hypothetical protein
MSLFRRLLIVLIPLLVAVVAVWPVQGDGTDKKNADKPAKASAEDKAAQLEENRRRVANARKDPDHYARLLRDLRQFMNLSPEQQDRLRRLDEDFRNLDEAKAAKLTGALKRYADWLERLPEADQKYIESAPNGQVRLQRVKELREKEWIEHLPEAKRDKIQQAQGKERQALINKYRKEDQVNKQKWAKPLRHWDEMQAVQDGRQAGLPRRVSELPAAAAPQAVKLFVEKILLPRLDSPDRELLEKAEGKWPSFPETLVQLADKYVPFPGPVGPRTHHELPPDLQRRVTQVIRPNTEKARLLGSYEGRWPDYAIMTANLARNPQIPLPSRQYPVHPADFGDRMPEFVREKLMKSLQPEERRKLREAEGKWPDYPRAIADLARKHNLPVPGMLPGSNAYWEKYRPPKPPPGVDAAKNK